MLWRVHRVAPSLSCSIRYSRPRYNGAPRGGWCHDARAASTDIIDTRAVPTTQVVACPDLVSCHCRQSLSLCATVSFYHVPQNSTSKATMIAASNFQLQETIGDVRSENVPAVRACMPGKPRGRARGQAQLADLPTGFHHGQILSAGETRLQVPEIWPECA